MKKLLLSLCFATTIYCPEQSSLEKFVEINKEQIESLSKHFDSKTYDENISKLVKGIYDTFKFFEQPENWIKTDNKLRDLLETEVKNSPLTKCEKNLVTIFTKFKNHAGNTLIKCMEQMLVTFINDANNVNLHPETINAAKAIVSMYVGIINHIKRLAQRFN